MIKNRHLLSKNTKNLVTLPIMNVNLSFTYILASFVIKVYSSGGVKVQKYSSDLLMGRSWVQIPVVLPFCNALILDYQVPPIQLKAILCMSTG